MHKSRKEWPRTIEEAVDKLLKLMSEDDKKSRGRFLFFGNVG